MNRIKELSTFAKIMLLLTLVTVLVFSALYPMAASRLGFAYRGEILTVSKENGNTFYSGEIDGKAARFVVTENKTVHFQYNGKHYGPYTAKEDPSAIPDKYANANAVGIELRCDNQVMFRGGLLTHGNTWQLVDKNGPVFDITISAGNGYSLDAYGNRVDDMAPSALTILRLMKGPELTHKGTLGMWLMGAFLCLLNILFIVFADEIFRFRLFFWVQDADMLEPSPLAMIARYLTWIALLSLGLYAFLAGLL